MSEMASKALKVCVYIKAEKEKTSTQLDKVQIKYIKPISHLRVSRKSYFCLVFLNENQDIN